jgi:hypothetical protein
VLSYEQTPNWQSHVEAGFGAIAAEHETLESDRGHPAAAVLALEASTASS